MVRTRYFGAYFSLIFSQLIVGANVAMMKYLAPLMPIYVNLELRFLFSTLLLGVLQLILAKTQVVENSADPNPRITRREWRMLAFMGVLGGLLFNAFMMEGVQLTSAMAAGIIVSTTPALIAFFSFLVLKEKLRFKQLVAIGFAMLGILILNLGVAEGAEKSTFAGVLLVFLAVVPEAFYTIAGKILGTRLKPISVAFLVNAVNVIYFLPLALWQFPQFNFQLFISDYLWVPLMGVAIGSAQFYILWQIGISRVPAQSAAIFTGLMPVGATLVAVFFLGESFGIYEFLGMLSVIIGLITGAGLFGWVKLKLPKNASLPPLQLP